MRDGDEVIGYGMGACNWEAVRVATEARVTLRADGTALAQCGLGIRRRQRGVGLSLLPPCVLPRLALALLLVAAAALAAVHRDEINPAMLDAWLGALGLWAPIGYVVVYALAGRMDIDLESEPLGQGSDGGDVYLRDLWPTSQEVADTMGQAIEGSMFTRTYADVFTGDDAWLEGEFIASVQQRGAAIIKPRGQSSAASRTISA